MIFGSKLLSSFTIFYALRLIAWDPLATVDTADKNQLYL